MKPSEGFVRKISSMHADLSKRNRFWRFIQSALISFCLMAPLSATAGFGALVYGVALSSILGDIDADDRVTITDLIRLQNYLRGGEALPEDRAPFGDMDQDGILSQTDLELIVRAILDGAEDTPATAILSTSPSNGESGVAVTRETVVRLSRPLPEGVSIRDDDFYAEFGGERLEARLHLSADRLRVSLFFCEAAPAERSRSSIR